MSTWRKSSYSNSGNCVEVGSWRKSSRCESGACVEVGSGESVVGVRDSKLEGSSPVLTFGGEAWGDFTTALKAGPSSSLPFCQ
jgi:hypothetical protein